MRWLDGLTDSMDMSLGKPQAHKLFQKSKANWEKQIADGGRLAGAGMGGLFTPPSAPGQPLMVRCHKPSLLELSDQVLEGSRI